VIYEHPERDEVIRQGDIFVNVPKVTLPLSPVPVIRADKEIEQIPWGDIVTKDHVTAACAVESVMGIVASQNCDAERSQNITLCEIKPISHFFKVFETPVAPKRAVKEIVQQTRKSFHWFYLPIDKPAGIGDKMGVDFLSTICVPREELLKLRRFRTGRLNAVAHEHFRERLSYFFHRYAYNEWYALNGDEIEYYEHYSELKDTDFYEWQKRAGR
jgi:hypothetical protein